MVQCRAVPSVSRDSASPDGHRAAAAADGPWFVRPVILAAAAIVLISLGPYGPRRSGRGVAALVSVRIADDWPLADNHIYLLAYWTLAIALALRATDVSHALSTASRWLLGLAFGFAVLWKVFLSPDYLDGRFFRVTLLTDPRFAEAAMLIGGLSADELEANRRALDPLPDGAALATPSVVIEPPRLRALAIVSTWGIVLLEVLVAITMLSSPPRIPVGTSSHPAAQFLRDHACICAGRWLWLARPRDGCSRNSGRQMSGFAVCTPARSSSSSSILKFPGPGFCSTCFADELLKCRGRPRAAHDITRVPWSVRGFRSVWSKVLKVLPHGTTFDGDLLARILASTGVSTWPSHHRFSTR